jgi:hypothetical protein
MNKSSRSKRVPGKQEHISDDEAIEQIRVRFDQVTPSASSGDKPMDDTPSPE